MPKAIESFAAAWDRLRAERRRFEPEPLSRTREEAWRRFERLGLPTTRDEEWRFTSVAPIAERTFVPGSGPAPEPSALQHVRLAATGTELVFVNGRYAPALSRPDGLPRGCRAESLTAALDGDGADGVQQPGRISAFERHPFAALNTALFEDAASIHVPAGMVLEAPIHVLFVATGDPASSAAMSHPRVLIALEPNSQATVVETYVGPDGAPYLTNAFTGIVLGENAVLHHYRLQYEGAQAFHTGGLYVDAARSATCASHSVSIGGALVRNDVVAVLDGEGGECTLNGLYMADAERLVDNHTTIDHARPHCASREVYKGILADRARGVFNGKIVVRPDAQKTDARQTNRALLLSEDALINTKPQLEIFANDVKCTHGAAVGQLDDEAVFYLRSRGLGIAEARRMLIHAFAADVLNQMGIAEIRAAVDRRLQRGLARVLEAAAA